MGHYNVLFAVRCDAKGNAEEAWMYAKSSGHADSVENVSTWERKLQLSSSTPVMYRDRSEKEEARRKIRESAPGKSDLSHIHRHTERDMLLQQMSVLSVREFMGCLWPWMCLRHRLQKHTKGPSHKNKARQKFTLAVQVYASDSVLWPNSCGCTIYSAALAYSGLSQKTQIKSKS